MNRTQQAIEFRRVFGQKTIQEGVAYIPPESLPTLKMQLDLIQEEGNEFKEALDVWASFSEDGESSGHSIDVVRQAKECVIKELSDLAFVCEQMAAFLGIDLETAMCRVFKSNMSKLDENGKPIYREDGKILKGSNYQPPDLSDLV